MKIAVFHTAIDNIGGAEIVCLTLAQQLKATLYTTNIDRDKIDKMGFSDVSIKSIGSIPINAPLRQQKALYLFHQLNLKNTYDYYIIGGDWAVSAALNHKPNLWYVHSPIREIWDLYEYTRQNSVKPYLRYIFDIWVNFNRYLNKKYIRHVQKIACNSKNTQNRIKKYLLKNAEIIYPPIDTSKYQYKKNGDFWLSVNRLISHKRVEIQIEAFKKLPNENLTIVGSYEQSKHFKKYADYIVKNKPENVKIIHWADDKSLAELYATCKGFITTAHDEDFGMTVIEAMAAGKFIIAPNEGGYQESIINNKTGYLIDNITTPKLIDAINNAPKDILNCKECSMARAKDFDVHIFIEKIKRLLKENR